MDQALEILRSRNGDAKPYAGGTDLVPLWSRGVSARPGILVDLKEIDELKGVEQRDGKIRIGPCTLMSEIENDPLIQTALPILSEAASRVACAQVRNRATIGGNLCNASPAADTALPLILADAEFELSIAKEGKGMTTRRIPSPAFFKGPGSTVLTPGELLSAIVFDSLPAGAFCAWDKFGTRPSMEVAIASVGLVLLIEGREVTRARIACGSVAPTPMRAEKAEAAIEGGPLFSGSIEKCVEAARVEISPITDIRAGGAYRREVVGVMLKRMLERALNE